MTGASDAGAAHLNRLSSNGWTVVPSVVPSDRVRDLGDALRSAEEECARVRGARGLVDADGSAHHLLAFRGPFLDFLADLPCDDLLREFLGGPYVLNSFGASVNRPTGKSYLHNVHRDVRAFSSDLKLMVNMLVMLDEFTLANGATYLLSGTHLRGETPSSTSLEEVADRAIGRAGDILIFDSRLWHAAAPNRSDAIRRALTLTFTPPFVKPQCDYPRLLGYTRGDDFAPRVREIIGYDARIPSSLEEWYQPPSQRFYKARHS